MPGIEPVAESTKGSVALSQKEHSATGLEQPQAAVMKAWVPFFEEYVGRIKKIVLDFHRGHGVLLGQICRLGFSRGAAMAQDGISVAPVARGRPQT